MLMHMLSLVVDTGQVQCGIAEMIVYHLSSPFSLSYINTTYLYGKHTHKQFECEFRRFHVDRTQMKEFNVFYTLVKESHHLPSDMPFTVSYTDPRNGDLLPITNDENLERAFTTAMPLIRLVIYRKQGEAPPPPPPLFPPFPSPEL